MAIIGTVFFLLALCLDGTLATDDRMSGAKAPLGGAVRPPMMPDALPGGHDPEAFDHVRQQIKEQSGKVEGYPKSKTMLDVVVDYANGAHAYLVQEGFNQFFRATKYSETEAALRARKMMSYMTDDSQRCTRCQLVFGSLQEAIMSANATWADVEAGIIAFCDIFLPAINISNVQCDVVPIQGPHVFHLIKNVRTPLDVCETQNSCFPPKSTSLSHAPVGSNQKPSRRHGQATAANTILVALLTDIHIQPAYLVNSDTDCQAYVCCTSGQGTAGEYGDHKCNTPMKTVNLFLDKVKDLDPAFIIQAGDNPPHTVWHETLVSQLNCSKLVVDAFLAKLPDYKVYPNIGNHEMFPTNLYSTTLNETLQMNEKFAEMWMPLAGFQESQMATMRKLAYYSLDHSAELKILSINTNYNWYTDNWYATFNNYDDDGLDAEMKAFVEDELTSSRTNGQKVIVITHHPTGISGVTVRASRWWEDVTVRYSDVIVLHVSGHTHNDDINLFYDSDGKVQSMLYIQPAVSPSNSVNPSMRIYYLDELTYEVIDYDQYFLDLNDASPTIKLNYKASDLYSLADMSPASWEQLLNRFEAEDDLFQQWYLNYRARSDPDAFCDAGCKKSYMCSLRYPNYDEVIECEEAPAPVTTTGASATTRTTTNGDVSGTAATREMTSSVYFLFSLVLVWLYM